MIQLLFAWAFIALSGFLLYKMILPLCLKIIDLCFLSPSFRFGLSLFLAGLFCAGGLWQLNDFLNDTLPDLSKFFPLSFLLSGTFLFLAFKK